MSRPDSKVSVFPDDFSDITPLERRGWPVIKQTFLPITYPDGSYQHTPASEAMGLVCQDAVTLFNWMKWAAFNVKYNLGAISERWQKLPWWARVGTVSIPGAGIVGCFSQPIEQSVPAETRSVEESGEYVGGGASNQADNVVEAVHDGGAGGGEEAVEPTVVPEPEPTPTSIVQFGPEAMPTAPAALYPSSLDGEEIRSQLGVGGSLEVASGTETNYVNSLIASRQRMAEAVGLDAQATTRSWGSGDDFRWDVLWTDDNGHLAGWLQVFDEDTETWRWADNPGHQSNFELEAGNYRISLPEKLNENNYFDVIAKDGFKILVEIDGSTGDPVRWLDFESQQMAYVEGYQPSVQIEVDGEQFRVVETENGFVVQTPDGEVAEGYRGFIDRPLAEYPEVQSTFLVHELEGALEVDLAEVDQQLESVLSRFRSIIGDFEGNLNYRISYILGVHEVNVQSTYLENLNTNSRFLILETRSIDLDGKIGTTTTAIPAGEIEITLDDLNWQTERSDSTRFFEMDLQSPVNLAETANGVKLTTAMQGSDLNPINLEDVFGIQGEFNPSHYLGRGVLVVATSDKESVINGSGYLNQMPRGATTLSYLEDSRVMVKGRGGILIVLHQVHRLLRIIRDGYPSLIHSPGDGVDGDDVSASLIVLDEVVAPQLGD